MPVFVLTPKKQRRTFLLKVLFAGQRRDLMKKPLRSSQAFSVDLTCEVYSFFFESPASHRFAQRSMDAARFGGKGRSRLET